MNAPSRVYQVISTGLLEGREVKQNHLGMMYFYQQIINDFSQQ